MASAHTGKQTELPKREELQLPRPSPEFPSTTKHLGAKNPPTSECAVYIHTMVCAQVSYVLVAPSSITSSFNDNQLLQHLRQYAHTGSLEKMLNCSRGHKKGQDKGPEDSAIWENYPNPCKSFKINMQRCCFKQINTFGEHLYISLNSLPKTTMVRMIHVNTF